MRAVTEKLKTKCNNLKKESNKTIFYSLFNKLGNFLN